MDIILAATSIVPDRSVTFTVTVVLAGLGIVLGTLALLILVFSVFGKAVSSAQKKAAQKKAAEMNKTVIQPKVTIPPPVITDEKLPAVTETEIGGISPEIVAVISAAVYAFEGEGAKITSISRKKTAPAGRNPWAQAAVIDNTRPF